MTGPSSLQLRTALAATFVLAATAACDRKPEAPPAAKPVAAAPAAPPQPLTFSQSTPDAEVSLSLPTAVGAVPSLYAKLYSETRNDLRAFADGAKGELDDLRANGEPVHPYERRISYTVSAETPRLISLVGTEFENTGGAHPNDNLKAMTWDKQVGREVAPADLFARGLDMRRVDRAFCDAIHAAKQARTGDPAINGSLTACPRLAEAPLVLAPSTVPGKAGGLTALFPTYALGPRPEGDYRIILPLAAIKDVLAPAYAAEFAGGPVPPAAQASR